MVSHRDGLCGSPALVVKNNDESLGLCVNYSRRNKITLDNSFPCPNVDSKLPEFKGNQYFQNVIL